MWLFRLVLVIFILGFADFVFSESAWILWKNEDYPQNILDAEKENWKIEQSYQTMGECQRSLRDFVIREEKYYTDSELPVEVKPQVKPTYDGNKGQIILLFKKCEGKCANEIWRRDLICLPDTIDPRSPKR